jgi:hypothetical protein
VWKVDSKKLPTDKPMILNIVLKFILLSNLCLFKHLMMDCV